MGLSKRGGVAVMAAVALLTAGLLLRAHQARGYTSYGNTVDDTNALFAKLDTIQTGVNAGSTPDAAAFEGNLVLGASADSLFAVVGGVEYSFYCGVAFARAFYYRHADGTGAWGDSLAYTTGGFGESMKAAIDSMHFWDLSGSGFNMPLIVRKFN